MNTLAPPSSATTNVQAALAAELATQLLPLPEILDRYDLTREDLTKLLADPQFKHMVVSYRREWSSPMTARERVRTKASLAVEDGIPELHRLFYDPETHPSTRLDAYKQLVTLADMAPKKDAPQDGASFSLTLNLGGDTPPLVLDASPAEPAREGSLAQQTHNQLGEPENDQAG